MKFKAFQGFISIFFCLLVVGCNKGSDTSTPAPVPACTSGFDVPGDRCYEACDLTQNNHRSSVGRCEPDEQVCTILNGSGKKVWNIATLQYDNCQVVSCAPNYEQIGAECLNICNPVTHHRNPSNPRVCDSNLISCPFPNGYGERIWDSINASYGACSIVGCNPGYFLLGGQCIDETLREYNLQISKTGGGLGTITDGNSVSCMDNCSIANFSILKNRNVVLYAGALNGYEFLGWSGDAASCGTNPVCPVYMDRDKIISTQFKILKFNFNLTAPMNGTVTGTASGQYDYGTQISLTANAAPSYKFTSWSAGSACATETSTTCSFAISSNQQIAANFVQILPPTVQYSAPTNIQVNNLGTTKFTLTFIDAVSVTLNAGNIIQGGTAPDCSNVSVATISTNVREVTLTGCLGNGTKQIKVAANVSLNELNQPNIESPFGPVFTVDNTPPSVTFTNPTTDTPTDLESFPVAWTSSETVITNVSLHKKNDCSDTPVSSAANQTSPYGVPFSDAGYFYVKLSYSDISGNPGVDKCSSRITKKGISLIQAGLMYKSKGSDPKLNKSVQTTAGVLIFPATSDQYGTELYYYDPNQGSGGLAADIYQGANSSNPDNLQIIGDIVYFVAEHPSYGRELFYYNTTSHESGLIKDIFVGLDGSDITSMIVANNRLYFTANDGTSGKEIWEHRPSNDVTRLAADINTGSGGSAPQDFKVIGNYLYMTAETPTYGRELVRIELGSFNIYTYDISTGGNSSNPTEMTVIGNKLYFAAETKLIVGRELYSFDMVADTFSLVVDLYPGAVPPSNIVPYSSSPYYLHAVNNKLFFLAYEPSNGTEWRVYDPSNGSTSLVQNYYSGVGGFSVTGPHIVSGNYIYFVNCDSSSGCELWSLNSQTNALTRLTEIAPANASSDISFLAEVNGKIYFNADDKVRGNEFWEYNPVNTSFAIAADYIPGSKGSAVSPSFAVVGTKLYMTANDQIFGSELYEINSANRKMKIVADLNKASTGEKNQFVVLNNKAYFMAATLDKGMELYVYDMLLNELNIVVDLVVGERSGNPTGITSLNNKIYFAGNGDTTGNEVYSYDPSTLSTSLVSDINSGINDSFPSELIVYNSRLYFAATSSSVGRELFWVNPSNNALSLVADLAVSDNSNPQELTVFNNKLFFTGYYSAAGGFELFSVDTNNSVGTVDVRSQATTIRPNNLKVVNNVLYFSAQGENTIWAEPYGYTTANQSFLLKNVNAQDFGNSDPKEFNQINGIVYFSANDGLRGRELWQYTIASAQSSILVDLYNGAAWSDPKNMTVINNRLYFTATDGFTGVEVWVYDPATVSLVVAADIYEGNGSGNPQNIQVINGKMYFMGTDATSTEYWQFEPSNSNALTKMSDRPEPYNKIQDIYLNSLLNPNELLILGLYNDQVTLYKLFE